MVTLNATFFFVAGRKEFQVQDGNEDMMLPAKEKKNIHIAGLYHFARDLLVGLHLERWNWIYVACSKEGVECASYQNECSVATRCA